MISTNTIINLNETVTNLDLRKNKGIDILFQNISYSESIIDNQNPNQIPCVKNYKQKIILRNVSGILKAGECTAIMGSSGAGKTSLLNILACRLNPNEGGKIYANSVEYDFDKFGNFANYVMQQDILVQTLTVRETLQFAMKFRPIEIQNQRDQIINLLIKMLKLQKCLNTLVGGPFLKGISGGEKKRVSIAIELLSDPEVLILDQPTSGLDSLTSYIIVYGLKKLAKIQNKNIIMTIHQPNSDIFGLFDRLILLSNGTIVYQGKINQSLQYFSQKFNLKCPQYINPAEFLIQKLQNWKQQNRLIWIQSQEIYLNNQKKKIKEGLLETYRQANKQFWPGLKALIERNFRNAIRDPMLIKSKIILNVFLSLYIGGLYFGIGRNDMSQIKNWRSLTGFTFFICINAMNTALNPSSLNFPLEREIFYKQESSGMYNTVQYFLAKNIIQLPELLIVPLISVCIYYFMIGLSASAQQFFFHLLIYFLISLNGSSLGIFLGSMIKDVKSMYSFLPIITLPLILFAGFYKNRQDFPPWIGWLEYISPLKYGLLGMIKNEIKGQNSLIQTMNFDVSKSQSVGLLILIAFVLRVLSVLLLWWTRKKL